jgi:hypothetical protein
MDQTFEHNLIVIHHVASSLSVSNKFGYSVQAKKVKFHITATLNIKEINVFKERTNKEQINILYVTPPAYGI